MTKTIAMLEAKENGLSGWCENVFCVKPKEDLISE